MPLPSDNPQAVVSELPAIRVIKESEWEAGDSPMVILLILVLLNLLFVAGFIAYWVIVEKRNETWSTAP